jgi:hypothetical protein
MKNETENLMNTINGILMIRKYQDRIDYQESIKS